MKSFPVKEQVFIKSSNKTSKILLRYSISLLVILMYTILYNIIKGNNENIIDIIYTLGITTSISIIFEYIINVIRKKTDFKLIFTENNIIAIPLILTILFWKEKKIIIVIATIITMIARLINKNINISSALYGILFVLIYKCLYLHMDTPLTTLGYNVTKEEINTYGKIITYLLNPNFYYTSILFCILSLIYLFNRKSIKYPVVFSYTITFISMLLIYCIIPPLNIWYFFLNLTCGNLFLYLTFMLPDYKITPISYEGQVIYGIILAITSFILKFILPEFAIIIPLILGPIILTKYIDKLSYKLKYNKKFYHMFLTTCIFLAIISIVILKIIY